MTNHAWLDLTGSTYGVLTVNKMIRKATSYCVVSCWYCKKERIVPANSLRQGNSKSCICRKQKSKHRAYTVWRGMHWRCYEKKHISYLNYGGRGIEIDWLWNSKNPFGLHNFIFFYEEYFTEGTTIDRKDNNGNYNPSNCRFIERRLQNVNRRLAPGNF